MTRALARELVGRDWEVTIVSGSRSDLGADGDAREFYAGLDVEAVDFTPALQSADPLRFDGPEGTGPMQPSFESRPGAPDRVFAELDDLTYERQVRAWSAALERASAASADVLWLHHLTPLHEAASRVAPNVPVVGHLHGTELLMLERIASGAPPEWTHAGRWAERMRGWAACCERLLVSPGSTQRVVAAVGVEEDRLVELPNGLDPSLFRRVQLDRVALWRRHLVEAPRGWRPGQPPGSVRYREEDLAAFADGSVLLYAGRFTEVKRLGLLIRAFASARPRLRVRSPLVIVGGHPGEWEGEHPIETVESEQVPDVFLAGWQDQPTLAELLAGADVIVLPSVCEQFGQVLVEGMACGLAAIAVDAFGPARIVQDGETGWLVAPDDESALAEAIVEAVNRPEERARRAKRAHRSVLERFQWEAIAGRLAAVLESAADARDAVTGVRGPSASAARGPSARSRRS